MARFSLVSWTPLHHPQVLTLQGPWSERDAQMTETFARLQDIYGVGRVLGILGRLYLLFLARPTLTLTRLQF